MTRFISTAIPYVNSKPHIGFALELFLADSVARAARQRREDVFFLSGSDDNSLKNALAAEQAGVPTQAFVDANAERFAQLCDELDISNDDFLRTSTDSRHRPAVEALWQACADNGDIYTAPYEGWYCVGCEQFFDASDAEVPTCPEHKAPLERICEHNYFFRLGRYQTQLRDWLDQGTIRITPTHRHNEVRRFLEEPLKDLSISRSVERARGWGIPVPGDPSQVVYVWFDALANYVSALGYPDNTPALERHWQHASRVQHVIGKGVTRFHAVYWPAILCSAGLRLPTDIFVHGYITLDGEKISKSAGNAVEPCAARDAWGLDALRYYLLRHVGSHHDGDFTWERLWAAYETELANQLGNLLSRVVTLSRRHRIGANARSELAADLVERSLDLTLAFNPQQALREIWSVIITANAYVSEQAPWQLAKDGDHERLRDVLGELCAALRAIGQALAPLLPHTSERLLASLTATEGKPAPLFPRHTKPL